MVLLFHVPVLISPIVMPTTVVLIVALVIVPLLVRVPSFRSSSLVIFQRVVYIISVPGVLVPPSVIILVSSVQFVSILSKTDHLMASILLEALSNLPALLADSTGYIRIV